MVRCPIGFALLALLISCRPGPLLGRAPRPPQRPSSSVCRSANGTTANVTGCSSRAAADHVVVLGLFELTSGGVVRPEGKSEVEAAKLAVHHVNSKRILGGVTLDLIVNDTKGDPGVGLDAFFHAIYTRRDRLTILLGSGNSEVTENLAKVVPYWNILHVSFGALSPSLSDRSEFPLFYRTIAPDSSHNPARIAFLKRFDWQTVTAFSQNENAYSLAVNDLVTEMETANITCKSTITFAETEILEQLSSLKEMDTRIIIGSFSQTVAQTIFCQAFKLGIYGGDYAWMLQGLTTDDWWTDTDLCGHDMRKAVDGAILVTKYKPRIGSFTSISGLSSSQFEAQMEGLVSGFAYETYDAIWAITLALVLSQTSVNIVNSDYTNKDLPAHLSKNMATLNFNGASGPVAFDGPDRIGLSAFHQIQGGKAVMIAVYDPYQGHLDMHCAECSSPVWPGGQVPAANRFFKVRTETVQSSAFLCIAAVAAVGICLAIMFLATNLHFRRHRYIKLSSPKLNNVAGVGCVLVYTAVILLGMDSSTLPSTRIFPTICTARVYLLSAGFSMAFGSMFAKTYRVHRIFTRNARGVKNKLLQDTQLISLICVLLVVDGLIVTLWVTIDPIERQLRNLSLEMSPVERTIIYQPQIEICSSLFIHNWLGALYIYKGLMLTVGVYMAWETRHVKIPALNDSQYIGLSVYSVVITSVLVVVLGNLVSERVTLAFLCIALPILVSTTGCLCLLFVPKLYELFTNKDNLETVDPVMHSMGLKIECNTRRFLTDDRRELYFRVEVQNKVYRRELQILDGEIQKLENQLEEGSSASSRSSVGPKYENSDRLEKLPVMPRRGKSTSVGGGIPVLLLSVFPSIPRASWPTEERTEPIFRRGVPFNSEPELDENKTLRGFGSKSGIFGPPNKPSMFGKLLSLIYSGPSSRKSSAPAGFVSTFKAHMFSSAVTGNATTTGSCDSFIDTKSWGRPYIVSDDLTTKGSDSGSLGCPAREHVSDGEDDEGGRRRRVQTRSVQSLQGPSVSFDLQNRKPRSQPTLNRMPRGSPRFPHRISPTVSLEALEDKYFLTKRHVFLNSIRQEPEGRDADSPQPGGPESTQQAPCDSSTSSEPDTR